MIVSLGIWGNTGDISCSLGISPFPGQGGGEGTELQEGFGAWPWIRSRARCLPGMPMSPATVLQHLSPVPRTRISPALSLVPPSEEQFLTPQSIFYPPYFYPLCLVSLIFQEFFSLRFLAYLSVQGLGAGVGVRPRCQP